RGGATIACEHHQAQTFGLKILQRLKRRRFDRVGNGNESRCLALDGHEDDGLATAARIISLCFLRQRGGGNSALLKPSTVAGENLCSAHLAAYTSPGSRLKPVHG